MKFKKLTVAALIALGISASALSNAIAACPCGDKAEVKAPCEKVSKKCDKCHKQKTKCKCKKDENGDWVKLEEKEEWIKYYSVV